MLTSRSSECERAIKRATSLAWQMATCEDDGHTLGTVVRHSRVSLGRVAARALCKGANFSSAAEASIRTADDGDSNRLPKASSKLMSGSSPLTEVPWYLSSIRQGVSSQLSAMGLPLAQCLFSTPAARGYGPRHFVLGSQRSHQSTYLNLCDKGDTEPPSHATGPHRHLHTCASTPLCKPSSCFSEFLQST